MIPAARRAVALPIVAGLALAAPPPLAASPPPGSTPVPAAGRPQAAPRAAGRAPIALRYFPLRVGLSWVYEETGEAQAEDGKVYYHSNRYTVRVAEVTHAGRATIARMVKYDRSGMTTFFYRAEENRLQFEPDPGGPQGTHEIVHIGGTLPHSAALYVFPMAPGGHWGETGPEREDRRYAYYVRRLENVEVPAGTFTRCAYIVYRTLTDHHSIWFKPDLGPVKYQYVHHGTVLTVNGKLIEYHVPQVATRPARTTP